MRKLITKNLFTLCIYEFVYNIIISLLIVPLMKFGFNESLKLSGLNYLNQENILRYMTNPGVIVILLTCAILITVVTIYNINAIILTYILAKQDQKIGFIDLVKLAFHESRYLKDKRNIQLLIYVVFLIPFFGIIYKNPIIPNLKIPNFIIDNFANSFAKMGTLIAVLILLMIFTFHRIYIFLIMMVNKVNYHEASKSSINLFKKTRLSLLKRLLIALIVMVPLVFLVILINNFSVQFVLRINSQATYMIVTTILLLLNILMNFIVGIFTKTYLIFMTADIFFENQELPYYNTTFNEKHKRYVLLKVLGTCATCFILFLAVFVTTYMNPDTDMAVMAHRGSSIQELENSKEAFLLAVKEGAQYIELDVVETKDHEVVVTHDTTLKRLTGVDARVQDLTLSEIQKLNFHSADGTKISKIITLKEILALIPLNVTLNIEMKPDDGNEDSLANEVEKVIANTPRHMVCSLNLKCLKSINKLNPKRTTGYIMAVALGDYKNINFIDNYSIEESFVTKNVVNDIHNMGKKIFVWTVNDEDLIENYYDMGVDSIITDYPLKMKKKIVDAKLNYDSNKLREIFIIKI